MENFDTMAKDYDAETRRVKRAQNVAARLTSKQAKGESGTVAVLAKVDHLNEVLS